MRIWVYFVAILLSALILNLLRGTGPLGLAFGALWLILFYLLLALLHVTDRKDRNFSPAVGELRHPTPWACSSILIAGVASRILAVLFLVLLYFFFC